MKFPDICINKTLPKTLMTLIKNKTNLRVLVGQQKARNYDFPSHISSNFGHQFGVPLPHDFPGTKSLIHNNVHLQTSAQHQLQYIKSHHAWAPEQQLTRNYKLDFEIKEKCFGKKSESKTE
jgi:hypothetical protein